MNEESAISGNLQSFIKIYSLYNNLYLVIENLKNKLSQDLSQSK